MVVDAAHRYTWYHPSPARLLNFERGGGCIMELLYRNPSDTSPWSAYACVRGEYEGATLSVYEATDTNSRQAHDRDNRHH